MPDHGNFSIRRACVKDAPAIALLYTRSMFDSVFSKLGRDFVEVFFSGFLGSRHSLSYVCEKDAGIIAFISAATNTQELFRELLRKKLLAFLRTGSIGLLRTPSLFIPLLGSSLYFQKTRINKAAAELLFITVAPSHQGKGIATQLIRTCLAEFEKRGIKKVKVATVKENHAVNRLLDTLGFCLRGHFKFYGKENLLYESGTGGHRCP
jgi:ribosomal protein S18 acetylase RimI-like enzyme